MAETGRMISRRYLLQRLLKQGQVCVVYQGFDQVLQRPVAVKVAPAEHVIAYRAALRATSQFSHQNIIGIYDLIVESESLYLVQEYVDGDDFSRLLQLQLTPYEVVDIGVQICQALLYAGSSSRKVCHGDLIPTSVMRDRRKIIRINNFAFPSDLHYFASWSVIGGDNIAVSDRDLPWGQISDARRSDDTRAAGVLLYQLLSAHTPSATVVDPPTDGRLRFLRNVPPELCEVVARSIVRQHPQYISTAEAFLAELKVLAEVLEPPSVISVVGPPAVNAYQADNMIPPVQFSPSFSPPGTGNLVTALPIREAGQAGLGLGAFRPDSNVQAASMDQMMPPMPSSADPTIAEMPVKLVSSRQTDYPQSLSNDKESRLNVPLMILLGLILFALFFVAGFYLAHTLLFR